MLNVRVDLDACQGYGNCIVGAEDVFDIDDDGIVVLLKTEVAETERARIQQAVSSCPVSAVWIES